MQNTKQELENQRQNQHIVKLANITLKEITLLENLIIKVTEYKAKYQRFEELAINIEIIESEKKKIEKYLTTIHTLHEKNLTNLVKHSLSLFTSNQEESTLRETKSSFGKTRLFIYKTLKNINRSLLEILVKNLADKHVKAAKRHIKEEINKQLAIGIPLVQLKDINAEKQLPNFNYFNLRSLELKLGRLSQQFDQAQNGISSIIHFDQEGETDAIIHYYQKLSTLFEEYIEIIDLAGKYDPDTLIKLLYATVPWLNNEPQAKERKLARILAQENNWVFDMTEKDPLEEDKIKNMVQKQHQTLRTHDDYRLHESYSSTQKSRPLEEDSSVVSPKATQIFGQNYQEYSNKFTRILDKFNTTNIAKKDEAASEAICFFLSMDNNLKNHISLIISKEYFTVFQRMMVEYPHVATAKKYDSIDIKEINPFASKIYNILQAYLNDSKVDKKQIHRLRPIINSLWKLYFTLNKSENAASQEKFNYSDIEKALKQYFATPMIRIDLHSWDFLHNLGQLLPANNIAENMVKKINDFSWPFTDKISRHIFSFLDKKSVLQSSLVCKKFNKLANEDSIWQPLCQTIFNKIPNELAKTDFGKRNTLKLVHEYLALKKEFFEKIVGNNGTMLSASKSFAHFHDFEFRYVGTQLISNVIEKNSANFAPLEDEMTRQKGPIYFKLIKTDRGYQAEITSVDKTQLFEGKKEYLAEIKKHEEMNISI